MINAWQTQSGLISIVLLLLFVIGVAVWGVMDGRADAKANPDPDRRQDLAMTWLLAGLVAGVLSGAVSWLIALFYTAIYTGGLINEVTTFAAFTALIVFLPGIIGVAVGRWRVDRQYEKEPREAPRPGERAGRHRRVLRRSRRRRPDRGGAAGVEPRRRHGRRPSTAPDGRHRRA